MAHAQLKAVSERCGCGGIDVHTHIVPMEFPPYLGHHLSVRWPSMVPAQPCHRHLMLDGEVFRTVSNQSWDPMVRVADMEQQRIAHQVLSPMPELLAYWLEGESAVSMTRFLNEQIAAMVATAPKHFTGLGTVPLQDMDRAIKELDHAVHEIGLAGVEVGSNVNGVPIGDPYFLPFFKAAESWGVAVFVHALKPAGMDRLVGPPQLEHAVAYPTEIGLAAASMITGGILDRCPRLRVAFSHGAGTLGQILPRLQHAWDIFPTLREHVLSRPEELARRVFVDDLVYGADAIRFLISVFGDTQVMVGSDYPFVIRDQDPLGRLARMRLVSAEHAALTRGNAVRWLDGISA